MTIISHDREWGNKSPVLQKIRAMALAGHKLVLGSGSGARIWDLLCRLQGLLLRALGFEIQCSGKGGVHTGEAGSQQAPNHGPVFLRSYHCRCNIPTYNWEAKEFCSFAVRTALDVVSWNATI